MIKTEKICTKCEKLQPIENFAIRWRVPDGRESWCKTCVGIQAKVRLKIEPVRVRKKNKEAALKARCGITIAEYDVLLASQSGVCALCFKPTKGDKRLDVDHDHGCCRPNRSCKKCIRGLLCNNCNRAALPVLERNAHLQNTFVKDYLKQRPFLGDTDEIGDGFIKAPTFVSKEFPFGVPHTRIAG